MQEAKVISRKDFGKIFLGIGAFLVVLGIVFNFILDPDVFFDLPIYIDGIGIIAAIYGLKHFLDKKNHDSTVTFSVETVKTFLTNNAIILALLVLVVVIMIIQPRFMQYEVMLDILTMSSTKLIVALGICFTLLIAGTDLSAGRMVGLAAVISTSMLQNPDYANRFFPNMPQLAVIIPIVIAIIACMVFGVLNGFLVAKYDMHPFIATLATQVIVYGACSLYFDMPPNKSQPIGGVRPDFIALGQTKLFNIGDFPGISILVPIALLFVILVWFILNKTIFGKNVYAIGGNREAAVVSGVNVFATIMGIFIFASLLYGVGGILEAARTAGATNQYGNGYELDAIAACVVGGVSLNGGVGKVGGIVSGVLIFTVIQYGLQFIAVSPMWQQVIKGAIIAVAVAIDLAKYRKK
ncbi:galactose/methyl galactoside ABC transporter permease MglC [Clostridium intestinale]|uniref:galactose/methyl galactoside ABC transporter permease MglC n=1 Tax=Clostridium intestinale TaxID=36845 RepID=UPI002DD648A7|nr:galactose/methyl galactoside ABC transporter permease MglC [Clostridium intestinale]WRY51690.1 galactose/methyl galactoside ABC transporter permease MglC [Clostridium intestinale]